jgi:hypothetical protein
MKEKTAKPKKFRQNTAVANHFHPRGLARAIVHSQLAIAGASGVNKVKPGTTQSPFAAHWREEADEFAKRKNR